MRYTRQSRHLQMLTEGKPDEVHAFHNNIEASPYVYQA